MTPARSSQCPACGAVATGNFCATCGARLSAATCHRCAAELAPGAKFCHVCGAPGDTPPQPAMARAPHLHSPIMPNRTPWIVAAVLAVVTLGTVVYAASRSPARIEDAPATATPPDLSTLTFREQFIRLNDRVTQAAEQGDSATVVRFWPMASQAYDNLPVGDRDVDTRFHMAWLHLLVAQYDAASALADSILQESPDNLFGYYVRASVADAKGDSAAARSARTAFRAHFDAEVRKTDHSEYADHLVMLRKLNDQKR